MKKKLLSLRSIKEYLARLGVAISILFNVFLGGPSNQTFSARNYGWKRKEKYNLVWFIDSLAWFDKNHCKRSWTYWKIRTPEYVVIPKSVHREWRNSDKNVKVLEKKCN